MIHCFILLNLEEKSNSLFDVASTRILFILSRMYVCDTVQQLLLFSIRNMKEKKRRRRRRERIRGEGLFCLLIFLFSSSSFFLMCMWDDEECWQTQCAYVCTRQFSKYKSLFPKLVYYSLYIFKWKKTD